jgi:hypothetical protein
MFAGQLPPDVNESHYLTKAKHGWDPTWCNGDLFLSSSFSHWLFYAAFGWLNAFLSLSQVAWAGRLFTWLLMAFAWQRLSNVVCQRWGWSVLSAALFLVLNEHLHLAGEWVVGGFEAKGLAYFFVLMAIGSLLKRQFASLWPFLGAASAFHVLVGGWATIAVLVALLSATINQRAEWLTSIKRHLLPLGAALALALIGVLPPLLADLSIDPATKSIANEIYVDERISHHLSFGAFSAARTACFAIMLVSFALINRQILRRQPESGHDDSWRMLFGFTVGSLLISLGGLALSGISEQHNESLRMLSFSLLRFYWFRLADFAVPLAIALGSIILLNDVRGRAFRILVLVSVVICTGLTIANRHSSGLPRADAAALPVYPGEPIRTAETYQNFVKVCHWIHDNTPASSVFITPDKQQTFKWYAQRQEVVNWKDVPQDAGSMLEWRTRVDQLIEPQRRYPQGLMAYSDQQLIELANSYGASHLLLPQWQVDMMPEPTELKQIYPTNPAEKATYVVLEF